MTSRRRRVTERRRLRRWRRLRQRRHFSLRRQRLRGCCCSSQHPWRGHFSPILAEWRALQPPLQQFEFSLFPESTEPASPRRGGRPRHRTPPSAAERLRSLAVPSAAAAPHAASEPRGGRDRRRGWLPEGGQTAGLPRPRAGFRRHGPGTALGLEPGTGGLPPAADLQPRQEAPVPASPLRLLPPRRRAGAAAGPGQESPSRAEPPLTPPPPPPPAPCAPPPAGPADRAERRAGLTEAAELCEQPARP